MQVALVADDEPLIRRQAAETLLFCGFDEILQAADGRQAIELAVERRPQVIVMDIGMPGVDGITAAEKIGKIAPAPILLLTGSTDPKLVERARMAGVMNYLVKPFREEQLCPAIDLAIHHFILLSTLREEVARLKETLETRKRIELAKAALMNKGMTEPEAYRKMQKLAMDKRKNLKEIAAAILLLEHKGE